VEAIAVESLRSRFGAVRGTDALRNLAKRVAAGDLDPYAAADQLVSTLEIGTRESTHES
jgi:LAO/AO transport system kinase